MKESPFYIPIINILRGLAALSVCLYHFVCTTQNFIESELLLDIFYFGQKGVEVFFIISGIVIPLSMVKAKYTFPLFKQFLLRRFIRIEPPYLGAVILGTLYLVIRNYIPGTVAIDLSPSILDFILHLGYLVPFFEGAHWINSVFWTLSIEFQFYLFLALAFPLAMSKKLLLRLVFYAIMLIGPFFFSDHRFFTFWMAFFFVGVVYALFKSKSIQSLEFLIAFALALIAVFVNQGLIQASIACGTIAIIHFFSAFKNKLGNFLGDISYSLYLLHSIIGAAFVNFLSHYVEQGIYKFLLIIGGIAISILSAYFYWKWVERPSQKWSKKIELKR
ncbi:MAG: acyltransferase [Bacteroidota bacterium]